jgi:hypothetical protein
MDKNGKLLRSKRKNADDFTYKEPEGGSVTENY